MFVYEQSTGKLSEPGQGYLALGYSGNGAGKNNPEAQDQPGVGPLPQGRYTMRVIVDGQGSQVDYEGKHSPVIRLIPSQANQMFGRSGFLVHGDSYTHPGQASNGCIVLPKFVRDRMAELVSEGDDQLEVISGLVPQDPEISV